MTSRVTPYQQLALGQLRVRSQSGRLADLRDQISSGLRVRKPSDDPIASKQILQTNTVVSQLEARLAVINSARSTLNAAHTQVREAQQLIVNARNVALQSRQITSSSEAAVLAQEVDGILDAMDAIANAQHNGRYLFAGTGGDVRPFQDVKTSSQYSGEMESGSMLLTGAGDIRTWYSGLDVFSSGAGGVTQVTGTTGAVGGSGTASGHGSSELVVQHSLTSFSGASGIQPGLSSAGGDTIIGPSGAHQLQIVDTSGDGSAGTVSLNGGPSIAFTSSNQDLLVTGPLGETVFLNTTTIAGGFSGTVDLASLGTLSLDGGVTQIPIDFSANQLVTDAAGNVRYIDSREITRTGTDEVRLEGATGVFEALRDLRDDLRDWDEYSSSEWSPRVSMHIESLENAGDHLLNVIGEQSVALQQLERLDSRSEQLKLDSQKLKSEVESTDMATAVLELQELQNLTEFSFAALSGVLQLSVLDYLR